jgi:hypothetical protein
MADSPIAPGKKSTMHKSQADFGRKQLEGMRGKKAAKHDATTVKRDESAGDAEGVSLGSIPSKQAKLVSSVA